MQNIPHRWERFEKMIRKKENEGQHLARPIAAEKFATDTLSKEEKLNEMEFDVTQWQNTLWMKRKKHLRFSPFRENSCEKETVDGRLKIDMCSPFPKELPGEALDKKVEKGNYLARPAAVSIGIDSLELVSIVVYG
ncbi:hypothetical protein LOAG_00644 [Loa loa]|nr:hypothetical protein LOAG_00644 [Loa loa]EFO27831.1 hypothetical protein LOAG_00644 [Loa loa]